MSKISKTKKEIEKLSTLPDNAIDKSDIPELGAEYWRKHGQMGKFYRPIKKAVTIRIDADVLAWFKSHNRKYQTAVNQALREYMESHSSQ